MTTDERIDYWASLRGFAAGLQNPVLTRAVQEAESACRAELDAAQKREQAQQAAWDRDWQAAVAAHDKCVAELDAANARATRRKVERDAALERCEVLNAREATLREALKKIATAHEAHMGDCCCFQCETARAALAAGEDTRG